MAWSDDRPPRNPKYKSREHLDYVRAMKADLAKTGHLTCTAPICLFPTRLITNPDGRDPDGAHAGHNPDGVTYAGPQHAACNLREASVRARARQIAAKQAVNNPKPTTSFTTGRTWGG